MTDIFDIPLVEIPGSEGWRYAYEYGVDLERIFPDQYGSDFAHACTENDWGPCPSHNIIGLLMVQEGQTDEESWIWLVSLDDGSHWWAEGSCDYIGWDCQSSIEWTSFLA